MHSDSRNSVTDIQLSNVRKTVEVTGQLYNFHNNAGYVRFSATLGIRRAKRKQLRQRHGVYEAIIDERISKKQAEDYQISARFTYSGDVKSIRNEIERVFTNVLTALRLTATGDVGIKETLYIWDDPQFPGIQHLNETESRDTFVHRYVEKLELDSLRSIYAQLDALTSSGNKDLSVAIRRFNQSYTRRSSEDIVLDCITALESTLLAGIKDELTYRLALLGAALLSPAINPARTRNELEALYNIRSSIVHSGVRIADIPKNKSLKKYLGLFPVDNLGRDCEQLTRQVLRKYLAFCSTGMPIKNVNDFLEARIIKGLSK